MGDRDTVCWPAKAGLDALSGDIRGDGHCGGAWRDVSEHTLNNHELSTNEYMVNAQFW